MSVKSNAAAAAANRFGLGAKPGEFEAIGDDPRGWLRAQLRRPPATAAFSAAFDDLPSGLEMLRRRVALLAMNRQQRKAADAGDGKAADTAADPAARVRRGRRVDADPAMRAEGDAERKAYGVSRAEIARDGLADIGARYRHAVATDAPLIESFVRFWSNHFAVSIDKNAARLQAAPMEREAIRPHVLGNFADMLLAVETHPAMLLYLDNTVSVGDGSMLAQRAQRRGKRAAESAAARDGDDGMPARPPRKVGLNENLAREILELHTLGVDGGYRQDDVRELARAISGWSTPGPREIATATSAFAFRAGAHEPGARSVLGKRYAEAGEAQGRAILRDLALHPATAKHLSFKLARHVVADAPPPALVQRMAAAYLRSGGELRALYQALIDDDAAWPASARKFKTPDDYVLSAMRAGADGLVREPRTLIRLLDGLGQPVFTPRSPAGFPDTAGDWATGDALRKRVQAAGELAERIGGARTPLELARGAFGDAAGGDELAALLRRAGSPQEGYALLFSSPAFQWRA